jgi:shikimate dehydrogenase
MPSSVEGFEPVSIDGNTRLVVIIADPVAQVKSPLMFNAYFRRHEINAVLIPAHVEPDKLAAALEGFRSLKNLAGVVVTVPHKMQVTKWVEKCSSRAAAAGAMNCLRVGEDGNWEGDNFDGDGFVRGLEAHGHDLAHAHVLLVGAGGGAGSALAHALCEAGIARLDLHDVAADSLAAVKERLRVRYSGVALAATSAVARPEHGLVINASPMGMRPSDACPIDIGGASASAVIADLIMQPECTELLARAARQGLRTHAGRHLLEHSVEQMVEFLRLKA